MLASADSGVVYGFRAFSHRDNNIRYNLFTDIPNNNGQQYAIYNDGSHAWNIIGNIFYDAGAVNIMLNGGRDNYVSNNICIKSETGKTSFLVYHSGLTAIDENGEIMLDPSIEHHNAMEQALSARLEESSPYYDLRYEKWSLLFDFSLDFENVGDYDCIYTTVNHIKNNYLFNLTYSYIGNSLEAVFGDIENNLEFHLPKTHSLKIRPTATTPLPTRQRLPTSFLIRSADIDLVI